MSLYRVVAQRRARLEASGGAERGSSLLEMMMVLGLLAIVLAFVFGGIDSMQGAIAGEDRRTVNINEGRVLMASTTRDLRTATRLQPGTPAFTVAGDRQATFFANLDNPTSGPKMINLYVDAQSRLVEQVTPPDVTSTAPNYTYVIGPTTVRFVGQYVANPLTTPIFTYLDINGNPLTATPLSATDRLAINGVRINLAIRQTAAYSVSATYLVNQVRLPNLDFQQVTG